MDNGDQEKLEQNRSAVNLWVEKISGEGVVDQMDPALVRSVLEGYGATFEISETAKESLTTFPNTTRRHGMNAVWGEGRVKEYRIWLRHWVKEYENRTGCELPVLEGTDVKTSGGLKFFSDLTVFAAGLMEPNGYKHVTERRAKKGKEWQTRDQSKLHIPTSYSSFPPGFPHDAWEKIKSLHK